MYHLRTCILIFHCCVSKYCVSFAHCMSLSNCNRTYTCTFSITKHTTHCEVNFMTLHPLIVSCTVCVVSLSNKSLSLLSYNIMAMCWQQNPEDRLPFLQIVEKLRTFNERLKTESICLDCDSLEDPGEFERGDSGRSWIRGSLRDSIRRIRTSIHQQNSVCGVRRQSSFKGELTTNGQVSIHLYFSSVVEGDSWFVLSVIKHCP